MPPPHLRPSGTLALHNRAPPTTRCQRLSCSQVPCFSDRLDRHIFHQSQARMSSKFLFCANSRSGDYITHHLIVPNMKGAKIMQRVIDLLWLYQWTPVRLHSWRFLAPQIDGLLVVAACWFIRGRLGDSKGRGWNRPIVRTIDSLTRHSSMLVGPERIEARDERTDVRFLTPPVLEYHLGETKALSAPGSKWVDRPVGLIIISGTSARCVTWPKIASGVYVLARGYGCPSPMRVITMYFLVPMRHYGT